MCCEQKRSNKINDVVVVSMVVAWEKARGVRWNLISENLRLLTWFDGWKTYCVCSTLRAKICFKYHQKMCEMTINLLERQYSEEEWQCERKRMVKLWDSFRRRRSNHLRMHETLDSTCENWTYHMAAGDDASYFYSFIRNFISVARIMHLITIDSSLMMTSLTHCNYIHCDPILVILISFSRASVIKQILKFFFNF